MEKEALKHAFKLLNRKDYTQKELKDKLLKKGFNEALVEEVVEYLRRKNLINDFRFAENYVFFRIKKGYGKQRIRYELLNKGVDESVIDRVLYEIEENAEDLFLKKLSQLKGKKNKKRRLFDMFYRRGFDKETILSLMDKYEVKDENI